MRKLYVPSQHCFDCHYQVQKGGGSSHFPIYSGAGVQKGYGIGGLFSGLAKMAIPMLKTAAKSAGRTLLKSGVQFAGDLAQGKNFKQAAKQRALEAGKSIGSNVLANVRQIAVNNLGNKKRKPSRTTASLKKAKRKRTSTANRSSDIFG